MPPTDIPRNHPWRPFLDAVPFAKSAGPSWHSAIPWLATCPLSLDVTDGQPPQCQSVHLFSSHNYGLRFKTSTKFFLSFSVFKRHFIMDSSESLSCQGLLAGGVFDGKLWTLPWVFIDVFFLFLWRSVPVGIDEETGRDLPSLWRQSEWEALWGFVLWWLQRVLQTERPTQSGICLQRV